uniref:Alcohol dehydrogenase-like C-terminal domain-containing protein n=1 Tax=Chenopodium quinoa TaxID=63459 RepID=A0A803KXD5_CHEQI
MGGTPEDVHPQKAFGWAARDSSGVLSPFNFSRRATGDLDVTFKVLYVGICHSDLHFIKNEWGADFISSSYPAVPGVVYSEKPIKDLSVVYSEKPKDLSVVYSERPKDLSVVYSKRPIKDLSLDKPGLHIGVVGLGGLGHMAVKFAKAFGAKVTVISTSPNKKEEAVNRLGADSFFISRDPEQIQTVSAVHPLLPLIGLLKTEGKLIMVGAPDKPLELPVLPLLLGRKMVAGSGIGGMKETQEMINFAAKHNIKADIEIIPMDYVNTAMDRLLKVDVRYRFVIDIGNTLKAT